jgi:hypothetical protein
MAAHLESGLMGVSLLSIRMIKTEHDSEQCRTDKWIP